MTGGVSGCLADETSSVSILTIYMPSSPASYQAPFISLNILPSPLVLSSTAILGTVSPSPT